jgi:hypothetical protein
MPQTAMPSRLEARTRFCLFVLGVFSPICLSISVIIFNERMMMVSVGDEIMSYVPFSSCLSLSSCRWRSGVMGHLGTLELSGAFVFVFFFGLVFFT